MRGCCIEKAEHHQMSVPKTMAISSSATWNLTRPNAGMYS